MHRYPLVSIVIVNWNSLQDTKECLASLARLQYDNFSIVVVDNGSKEDDADQIRHAYPHVAVLETKRNLGFTGGNNIGIQHALANQSDYILCLNNDTVVSPDFLSLMVDAIEADSTAGIVTAAIYYYDQPSVLNTLGCWMHLDTYPAVGYINDPKNAELESNHHVPFVEGCVLMMRRVVAERTGGFDDRLFAYLEDAELCLRTRILGWHCVAVPHASVWHKIGRSTGGRGSFISQFYASRNTCLLVGKHGTSSERRAFRRSLLKQLQSNWIWAFKESIVFKGGLALSKNQQSQVAETVGVLLGMLGCSGPRHRWRIFDTPLCLVFFVLVASGRVIGQMVRPVYLAWHQRCRTTSLN